MIKCPFCKSEVEIKEISLHHFEFTCPRDCLSNVVIFAHSKIMAEGYFRCRTSEIIESQGEK